MMTTVKRLWGKTINLRCIKVETMNIYIYIYIYYNRVPGCSEGATTFCIVQFISSFTVCNPCYYGSPLATYSDDLSFPYGIDLYYKVPSFVRTIRLHLVFSPSDWLILHFLMVRTHLFVIFVVQR